MASTSRFSEVEEDKIAEITDSAVPANTKRQTNSSVSVFNVRKAKRKRFLAIFSAFYVVVWFITAV